MIGEEDQYFVASSSKYKSNTTLNKYLKINFTSRRRLETNPPQILEVKSKLLQDNERPVYFEHSFCHSSLTELNINKFMEDKSDLSNSSLSIVQAKSDLSLNWALA